MAMPVEGPPAAAKPYGAGACANVSCQVSALAGNIPTISFGTTTTWPLTVMLPPQCGSAWQVESSVAAWMKPVTSKLVDPGIGSCALAAPAVNIAASAAPSANARRGAAVDAIRLLEHVPIRMYCLQSFWVQVEDP